MSSHSLHVTCPTWEHVENFCLRKVKEDSLLPARVPFSPAVGDQVQLGLETPDGKVVAIVSTVQDARRAPDGKKSAVVLRLVGFDGETKERLLLAAAQSREGQPRRSAVDREPPSPRTPAGAPVPIPTDAPIDELVEPVVIPSIDEVPDEVVEVFATLQSELDRLKELGAHEVLGVARGADVGEVRDAYFGLVKAYHPDVHARHDSPAIAAIVSELFIHINRAYDRLRDSAVASGQAIVAGPALLPHKGWLADFGDLGTVNPRPSLRTDDFSRPLVTHSVSSGSRDGSSPRTSPDGTSSNGDGARAEAARFQASTALAELFADASGDSQGAQTLAPRGDQIEEVDLSALRVQARELIAERDFERARIVLAEILEHDPRDRKSRALYHVAYGRNLLDTGRAIEATTQFEVALAHDVGCQPAIEALEQKKPTRKRRGFFRWLFRR